MQHKKLDFYAEYPSLAQQGGHQPLGIHRHLPPSKDTALIF